MPALACQYAIPRPFPRPRPTPRPKPTKLWTGKRVTIALHLMAGNFTLITATDTQETYASGEKLDTGKIIGYWQADPATAINIAGSGWSRYTLALSQDILRCFKDFSGATDDFEPEIRRLVREFHEVHIHPYVGKVADSALPICSLLIAASREGSGKLWATEKTTVTESTVFDCTGIGGPLATSLLNRFYPRQYSSLDSVAILAAYVIYRVKSSVDGCGLKTEVRFIQRDRLGVVPFDLIEEWETLFKRYERIEREIFYHSMNYILAPPSPPNMAFPPQMEPLPEIMKRVEEMRAEFMRLKIPWR
jgi:hypothetical protein